MGWLLGWKLGLSTLFACAAYDSQMRHYKVIPTQECYFSKIFLQVLKKDNQYQQMQIISPETFKTVLVLQHHKLIPTWDNLRLSWIAHTGNKLHFHLDVIKSPPSLDGPQEIWAWSKLPLTISNKLHLLESISHSKQHQITFKNSIASNGWSSRITS